MIHTSRESAEWNLAHALDRHVGYTTGAFHLDRIAEVALYFKDRMTIWEVEIVNWLMKMHGVTEIYAKGILDFGIGLGLVKRFEATHTAARITLTDLGRSYRGAHYCKNGSLQHFVLTYAVLAADCDFYGLLLESFACNVKSQSTPQRLATDLQALRERRISWLQDYFPDIALRRRITDKVDWLRKTKGEMKSVDVCINDNYARHHSFPRIGWAKDLGHVYDSGDVTPFGKEIRNRIRDTDGSYFWVGPSLSALEILQIPKEAMRKPLGPVWDLLRPQKRVETSMKNVGDLADFMEEVYPAVRLTQSNQASIASILPYLYMLERDVGTRYDEIKVLRQLFSEYGHKFAPLSTRSGLLGHYQLRTK